MHSNLCSLSNLPFILLKEVTIFFAHGQYQAMRTIQGVIVAN